MDYHDDGDNVFRRVLFVVAIFSACTPVVVARFTPYAKPVPIDAIPSLAFQKWKLTNYRRNEPVYQLKCVYGCEFEPDWVKCFKVQAPTDRGPAWRCEADLPPHLQFSTLEVICEGYESKDDKSILEGSCGLEYSLKHVALPINDLRAAKKSPSEDSTPESELEWGTCQWLILAAVMYVCCYCLYQVVQSDLKEASNSTHRKPAEYHMVKGRCGKCQSSRFSSRDPVKEKPSSELQGWPSDTPSECRKSNEQAAGPILRAVSTACDNRMRETHGSPPRSPHFPSGGFFKKHDRPSRSRKRDESDSPGT